MSIRIIVRPSIYLYNGEGAVTVPENSSHGVSAGISIVKCTHCKLFHVQQAQCEVYIGPAGSAFVCTQTSLVLATRSGTQQYFEFKA